MPGSSGPSSPARAAVTVSPYRDRRASTSSDTSDTSTASRQLSIDGVEVIPTRLSKVTASKPAANPLQFVKVGPCNLYRAAQETLKKVEEVKKIKEEVQNQEEDWQSNLDNWKSSRRKRQEHIIERVVEVKKLEMEEFDRNRRRSKTFNEMLEERNKTGRKMSLAVYKDEDANDLSDLGIGTHSSKSSISEEYGHDDNHLDNYSEDSRESTGRCVFDNHNGEAPKNGLNGHHDDDTSTTATISSPEPEEYTYERAIQGYVNFAENRAKTRAAKTNILNNINGNFDHGEHTGNETSKNNNCVNLPNRSSKKIPPPVVPRRQSAAKIEDRLTALEQRRSSQLSDVGTCESGNKVTVPKVDILKRRELFEKASDVDSQSSRQDRISGDFSNAKSIRERLSHLEKQNEENANIKERQILSSQVSSTVKERLSHFDRSTENLFEKGSTKSVLRLSNGDISSQTLRDRLSSLERSASLEREGSASSASRISEEVPHTIKERLSNLDSARNRVVHKVTPDRDVSFHSKLATFQSSDKSNAGSPECSLTPDDKLYQGKQQFHRSLDSLEVEGSCGAVENLSSFERVQSLEDVDCFGNDRNYPASTSSTEMLVFSTQSGDTDREDSGIHTADVSCSVSQADEPVEEGEATVSAPHLEPILDSYQESSETLCLGTKEPVEITQEHPQTSVSLNNTPNSSLGDFGAGSAESDEVTSIYLPACHPGVGVENSGFGVTTHENLILADGVGRSSPPFPDHNTIIAHDLEEKGKGSKNNSELVEAVNLHHCYSTSSGLFPEPVDKDEVVSSTPFANGTPQHVYSNPTVGGSPHHVYASHWESTLNDSIDTSEDNFEMCKTYPADSQDSTEFESCRSNISSPEPSESLATSAVIGRPERVFPVAAPRGVAAERRRTVVEVCEKVEVMGDQLRSPPPTPFINVAASFKDTPSSDDAALASMADAGAGSPEPQGPRPAAGETIEDSGSAEGLRGEAEGETAAAGEVVSDDSGVQISPYPSLLDKPTSEDEMFFPLIDSQIPPLVLSADIEVVAGLEFPLGPPTSAEPPKEKPPPPPVDLSDEDVPPPVTSLKRLDSTKRIKKEIRRKRSDFLGIEGSNDDSYLEPELKVAPPPDMTLFLVEERRSEQQLYRQSICSESDSALGETTDSRDSGVELDRGHLDDASWSGRPVLTPSSEHSRQDSELYGNASTTSEEEIMKREREIVETVEKEDQWHYKNTHAPNEQSGIGEKLAEKLRLLEQEKMRLEWEQVEEDRRLRAKEAELRQQEDQLRAERERLQQENQALELQKQQLQMQQRWDPTHRSLQDVSSLPVGQQPLTPLCLPPITETPPNYRLSLPNLQDVGSPAVSSPTRRPPPPIPPAKPLRPDRDATIRSSRVPSADSLPQQMSRHTLQALSAAPRSRFISTDTWMQAKRKPDAPRSNYQHWLVQEAEHRRITEQQQRNARSPRRLLAPVPPQPVPRSNKPLPDAIIQTLTQRVQNRAGLDKAPSAPQRRSPAKEQAPPPVPPPPTNLGGVPSDSQEKMLSVSGKKKCSHCGEELGRGAAMIIESLRLFYHIDCFKCCVCHVQLGDGLMGTDVRVRNNKLHCHNCYSSDDGVKFSCV
ncbi:uncharacterized protein LOC134532816 isoform X2 [Bacillus rossius redtenbacheri]|uniref:uncharacterized protein LOC134532816 isoform X2 n=1 Tax=Bacillus rossius redtenbacheri TaxID=93214 RepID=UPI002FDDC7CB